MLGGRRLPTARRFALHVCLSMAEPPGLVLSSPLVLVHSLELELTSHFQRRLCVFILNYNFSGKKKKNLFYSVFPGGWENVSWKQMYFLVVLRRKFEDLLYKGLTSLQKSSSSMQSCTAGYNVTIPGDPIKCIQCLTLVPGMFIPLLCLEKVAIKNPLACPQHLKHYFLKLKLISSHYCCFREKELG